MGVFETSILFCVHGLVACLMLMGIKVGGGVFGGLDLGGSVLIYATHEWSASAWPKTL